MFHRLVNTAVGFAFSLSPVAAQWLDYPTAGVPRMPDGKPNLSAPTPRTADGKPDLSGLWEMERKDLIGEGTSAIGLGDEPIRREFGNIGARLPGGLPYQPWAAQLVKSRTTGRLEIEIRVDDPKAYTKPWTVTLKQEIRLNTDYSTRS